MESNSQGTEFNDVPSGNKLFSEFEPASSEQWQREAAGSLKGKSFDSLTSKSYEEIYIKPIYRKEDLDGLEYLKNDFPGYYPHNRGNYYSGYKASAWDVAQELCEPTPEDFNKAARKDLSNGQNALVFSPDYAALHGINPDKARDYDVGFKGTSIFSTNCLENAFEGIDLEKIPVYIKTGFSAITISALFSSYLRRKNINCKNLRGGFLNDPIGVWESEGILPYSIETAFDETASLFSWINNNLPNFSAVSINGRIYQEAGAGAVQELGFVIAKAMKYIREMLNRDLKIDEIAPKIDFSLSIGSNFFMEIAKLRAARMLWAKAIKAFGGNELSQKMKIHASTCKLNKSELDPYVNMLRNTSEALAAVIGGCESLNVEPFDAIMFGLPDEFSRRTARNTQIILREECNLTETIDPAGGSWYIESLTNQIAKTAWDLFREIEHQGGFVKVLEDNIPQLGTFVTLGKRVSNLQKRNETLLGVNKYPNLQEKQHETARIDFKAIREQRISELNALKTSRDAFLFNNKIQNLKNNLKSNRQNIIEDTIEAFAAGTTVGEITMLLYMDVYKKNELKAFPSKRLAEIFEELRTNANIYKEKNGTYPKVFLANMGAVRQHKARADFSADFFQVGGFETIYPKGFESIDQAVKAALESEAKIVVICSTDETYTEIVPEFTSKIKEQNPEIKVILAGFPVDMVEEYKKAGIDEFIHVKANIYQVLAKLQKETLSIKN